MLLTPLDLPGRRRERWADGVALWQLVTQGLEGTPTFDSWRSYLVDVRGGCTIPATPTEPVEPARGKVLQLWRALLAVDGELAIDGTALPIGVPGSVQPGQVLTGTGRAVLLEQYEVVPRQPTLELVVLRAARPVRRVHVVVLSGRVALWRRFGGVTVMPPEHVGLGCTGELRPGDVVPRLVLIRPAG